MVRNWERVVVLLALLVYLLASVGDSFFHDPNWHPTNRILRWMKQDPPSVNAPRAD